jgi:putative CocE/NonD family hydrolase
MRPEKEIIMNPLRSSFFRRLSSAALVLACGCGAEAGPLSDLADDVDDIADLSEPVTSRHGRPKPDYTSEALESLAGSPEVTRLNAPFNPAPAPRRSHYVAVSDGTRLALSFYFPEGFDETSAKAPIAYIEGWYPRLKEAEGEAIDLYLKSGFVVVIGDPRGFGASFGAQPGFLLERARLDQREIVDWLTAQSWSNGKIATVGFSISATHAEALAASGPPGLGAVVLRESDFDNYTNNLFPGGVPNLGMGEFVGFLLTWMHGGICPDVSQCFIAGVDEDTTFDLLRAAFLDHQADPTAADFAEVVYRDDLLGGGTFAQMSGVGHIEELRQAAVPARVTASWLDGSTAESALRRFTALPDVPMELFIGAHTHSSGLHADPFERVPFQGAKPPAAEQYGADVAFVQRVLAGEAIERSVRYFVLGADTWKTTAIWPPVGVRSTAMHLTRKGLAPRVDPKRGERGYRVDPTTSSGTFTRWAAQTGAPVYYGDRRFAPGTRLTFDAEPVSRDTEIVGAAELCLVMRSDQTDGIVIAYLEDVAPDGRVTYLTEGQLRLIHRKTSAGACDPAPGTARTFARGDAVPVTPGELMRIELPLLPTAAVIRKGHHLRLALAGADAGPRRPFEFSNPGVDTFPMLTEVPATWSVSYGGLHGSSLIVPTRPWSNR